MRQRRSALVLAASLLAHVALLAAWMTTRPDLRLAESPTLEVQLVRLPPKAKPPVSPRRAPAVRPRSVDLAAPPPISLPLPPPLAPPAPSGPRPLTDEDLLAGAKPTAAQLQAGRDRTILFHGWPRGCKPMSEHSNRPGPPCPVGGPDDQASRTLGEKDPGHSGFAAEGRRREALKDYKDGPGIGGAYPGIRCTIFHRC